MKIGIVGKGGVGKTTLSALIAKGLAERGQRVIAIDTDSNPNLGMSLGLTLEEAEAIPVIPRRLVLGTDPGSTPTDLMAEYGRTTESGVRLLSAMRVDQAGAGCTCSSHASVRSILGAALEEEADVTLVDMEAGLEHLSRAGGTLAYADVLVTIMEPSRKSVITAARTVALADELGIPRTVGVGNKARLPADAEFFEKLCAEHGVELAAVIPYHIDVVEADRAGIGLGASHGAEVRAAVERLLDFLDGVPVG